MRTELIAFYTSLRRELYRVLSMPGQTIAGPLLETYLYISVFGAALGSRIDEINGSSYTTFIIPGLLLMSMIMQSYINNSLSIFQQKMMHAIDDQLSSPISNYSLLAAYTLGGFIRACIVVTLAFVTAILLLHFPVVHPLLFITSLLISGLFFASLGVLIGLVSKSFEQINAYQTFILMPLIFLGGTFYSVNLLPEPFKTITHFDPIFYMINTVRYGMLGHSDTNPYWSLLAVTVAVVIIVGVNAVLFKRGYKLRS